MGDLEEKADSAPKKEEEDRRRCRRCGGRGAINLKEFQKSEAKLKKEKEKTISARKLLKH